MRFDTAIRVDYRDTEEKLLRRCAAAEEALGRAVLASCDPYVPYDTGRLAGSAVLRISPDTRMRGEIVWNTPYAKAVYFGDLRGVTYSAEHHPHAAARWFEAAKSTELADWTRRAAAAAGGAVR